MASTLSDWKLQSVFVVTCDGRTIVGRLMGHDQVQNLILQGAIERIYSSGQDDEEAEEVPLGLYVIRGDNVVLIGELVGSNTRDDDDDEDPARAAHDDGQWKTITADPLPAIQQHIQ